MIFRLSYVSTVTTKAAWLSSVMEEILLISAANNGRDGITGFLVCDGRHFAQILEGEQDKVEACFARIGADGRNAEPGVRELSWAQDRAFPRWSMCGLTLSGIDNALLTEPDIGFQLPDLSQGALRQHLESLALRYADQLDREHRRLVGSGPPRGPAVRFPERP